MSNFKGFVTTDTRFFNAIGGANRGASTKAMMKNGIQECPIDLRFKGKQLDHFIDIAKHGEKIYALIEGTLLTREWDHDLDDGSVICGMDAYIIVESFHIISGRKE